jgi:cellulose synthase operon protein C
MSCPTSQELESLRQLIEDGRVLCAYRRAVAHGPLEAWDGVGGRITAGRLLRHVGSSDAGRRQFLRAYRWHPEDAESRFHLLLAELELRGPLEAWARLRRFGLPSAVETELDRDTCTLAGRLLSLLRDFTGAEVWYRRAGLPVMAGAWRWSEWCHHLVRMDRYGEALEWGRAALERQPQASWLVRVVAQAEMLMGQEEAALARLGTAARAGESAGVAHDWGMAAEELDRHEEALEALEVETRLLAQPAPELTRWLRRRRMELEYRLGRHAVVVEVANGQETEGYWAGFVSRLERPEPGWKRVELPVPFTRQHHLTCVPATLTTISRFWGRAAEHLRVAEAICHDGTPTHSERAWALENGWLTREFRVTPEATKALLDRGVPFCLTTVHPANAHEQAVIGYDDWRQSLLIRDPWYRNRYELVAETLLESQAPSGPRGMVLVPADREALLSGVTLPDAALYDLLHACDRALARHDRETAVGQAAALEAAAPGHRLAWQALRAVAAYDGNTTALLAAVDGLLALYPGDVNLLLSRMRCLRELWSRARRLEWLQELCRRPMCDPLLFQELALELSTDGREHAVARRWLRRARRIRSADAVGAHIWAGICWSAGEFEEALEHYRLAACLEDRRGGYWLSFVRAATALGRSGEVLARLEERFERLGGTSGEPARTLAEAYQQLDRTQDATWAVERGLERRPADGDLLVFAADQAGRSHRLAEAEALLERVQPLVSENEWRRAMARLAGRRQDPARALALWRGVLEADPLAMDAHQEVASLLAQLEGRLKAKEHLAAAVERFPHHVPLRVLWIEWLRDEPAAVREEAVRGLVTAEPEDAWARRELAMVLSGRGEEAAAIAEAELAVRLEPGTVAGHGILGHVLLASGRRDEGMESSRAALRLSVDSEFAQNDLMSGCQTLQERRAVVAFIRDELVRQTTNGSGLLHFLGLARPFLSPEELLQVAETAHRCRRDLWQSWLGLAAQLRAMGRLWEARELAEKGMARFPLVLQFATELAAIHRARMEPEPELAALERVRVVDPAWGWGMRELADALVNAGQAQRALEVLEHSVRVTPWDGVSWLQLGRSRQQAGDVGGAVAAYTEGVRQQPGQSETWERLRDIAVEARDPDLAVRLARELTERRPAEARSWMLLARVLPAVAVAERLEAIHRGLALVPDAVGLWRQRARVLMEAGRHDEAWASCHPVVFGERVPEELRAFGAVVLHERGRRAEAIAEMESVLEQSPGMDWAWRDLADWQFSAGQLDAALRSAQQLERLSPGDPMPLGFAAAVRLERGDKAGALELLRRAHELNAGYLWAGNTLMDLQIERGELADAARTLDRLRGSLPECRVVAREMDLEFAKATPPQLEPFIERFLRAKGDVSGAYLNTAERIVKVGLAERMYALSADILRRGGFLNPSAAMFLVCLGRGLTYPQNESVLDHLAEGTELARRGWMTHVEYLAERPDASSWRLRDDARTRIQVRSHRLGQEVELWGMVCYALSTIGEHRQVIQWMSDWKGRSDMKPWMFRNLVDSHLELGQLEAARAALQSYMDLPLRDHSWPPARLWVAIEAASRGEWESARQVKLELTVDQLGESGACLFRWVVPFGEWMGGQRTEPGPEAIANLLSSLGDAKGMRGLRRWIRQAAKHAARTGPGWRNRLRLRWELLLRG